MKIILSYRTISRHIGRAYLAGCVKLLHRDERGVAAADVILVIAAVSVPLIVALVAFGDDIVNYLENQVRKLS